MRAHRVRALQMRVDVMSRMRGVDAFPKLWKRRTTLKLSSGEKCDLLSLPDLVQTKKTQRDKDWPMIRRLMEAHHFQIQTEPKPAHIRFWFRELRTPELLVELARRYSEICGRLVRQRPLLAHAQSRKTVELEQKLLAEEAAERQRDKDYWLPLKAELEKLRHGK
jgi:hypothetical protein